MVASGNDTVPTHSHLFHTHTWKQRERKRGATEKMKRTMHAVQGLIRGKSSSILTHPRDTRARKQISMFQDCHGDKAHKRTMCDEMQGALESLREAIFFFH